MMMCLILVVHSDLFPSFQLEITLIEIVPMNSSRGFIRDTYTIEIHMSLQI